MSISEKLVTVAENQEKVFEVGKTKHYNDFWDKYQENGNMKDYSCSFAGLGWNSETFKPKYNINAENAYMIFRFHNISDTAYDLTEHLELLGVTLDFSSSASLQYAFYTANFSRIGVVDCSSLNSLLNTFQSCRATTIDKIIVHENLTFNNAFQSMTNLKNIKFEGIIGQSGLNFQWSANLSKDSIVNIIDTLSGETSEKTITFSKASVDNAFETEIGLADGSSSQEWRELIATKSNWTISLV